MPGRLVGCDEPLQLLVQHLELMIEGTEEFEQRRDHRGERGRERQVLHPGDKGLGRAGAEATPLPPEQRLEARDPRGAGPDHGLPDGQARAQGPALGRGPMGGAIDAGPARVHQGVGIAAVGLHAAPPLAVHRGIVRVGHDDLVAQIF